MAALRTTTSRKGRSSPSYYLPSVYLSVFEPMQMTNRVAPLCVLWCQDATSTSYYSKFVRPFSTLRPRTTARAIPCYRVVSEYTLGRLKAEGDRLLSSHVNSYACYRPGPPPLHHRVQR